VIALAEDRTSVVQAAQAAGFDAMEIDLGSHRGR
jgi:hypothetical protein